VPAAVVHAAVHATPVMHAAVVHPPVPALVHAALQVSLHAALHAGRRAALGGRAALRRARGLARAGPTP
jgi:hypothetical protein